jgi:hypothetical protein
MLAYDLPGEDRARFRQWVDGCRQVGGTVVRQVSSFPPLLPAGGAWSHARSIHRTVVQSAQASLSLETACFLDDADTALSELIALLVDTLSREQALCRGHVPRQPDTSEAAGDARTPDDGKPFHASSSGMLAACHAASCAHGDGLADLCWDSCASALPDVLPVSIHAQCKTAEHDRSAALWWSYKVTLVLLRHKSLWELNNWLSTLGGAHAALGDGSAAHAREAELLAHKQLRLAQLMQDRLMAARCKLYIAFGAIQHGEGECV